MYRTDVIRATLILAALVASSQSPTTAVAQSGVGTVSVTGRVTTTDRKPVANARVYVPGTDAATRTDANGNYALAGVPGGPQSVMVRAPGFAPTRVEAKFSTKPSDKARNHINVVLATPGQAMAALAQWQADSTGLVKVGFFQRQSQFKEAYFVTPDQIAQQKSNRVLDIFRGIPVITDAPGRSGPALLGAQGCLILYVDGLPWRSIFPGDLDTDIHARDVVAAEVYPPGFPPPAPLVRGIPRRNCTTAAIWTRSGRG